MGSTSRRLLFLTSPKDDYLSDSVLHGLRSLLGDEVVDFPKKESLYRGFAAGSGERYGLGFTLYGLLDDVPVDRHDVFERARGREFDFVVIGDVWRSFGLYAQLVPYLKPAGVPLVLLDGFDSPAPVPTAPHFWRTPYRWFLPRPRHARVYFKRELTPMTNTFRRYFLLPPPLNGWVPFPRNFRPLAFSIPEEKIVGEPPPKSQLLATHVVDREAAERLGREWGDHGVYSFTDEESYYADLRRSRFGITTKRAGWDALRHYETAANGCVPAFRDLDRKPTTCAPHGLDRSNCVVYGDFDHLQRQLDEISEDLYAELQANALAWARNNSTTARARQFLHELSAIG